MAKPTRCAAAAFSPPARGSTPGERYEIVLMGAQEDPEVAA
jgi:hypothetical protein